MDLNVLADLLYPEVLTLPRDIEARYPKRQLAPGAKVTRFAPSPTGFIHLGNLFPAVTSERLAHQSGGVFYLRIEDTDQKREVEGAIELLLKSFELYHIHFDEGATVEGEVGNYGPYYQRERAAIYQTYAKQLIREGKAYPCFCTEERLESMRQEQESQKVNFGYYGDWAVCRSLSFEQIKENLKAGIPFVLRFRSQGNPSIMLKHEDLVKGHMEFPQNDMDYVLLKSDGIPTYHFAHVIDDHLMGTTHVVRGEEWLSTLPFHLQLFEALGFETPYYLHLAQLMKLDNGSKRKLSKRKDPEASLAFYYAEGYPAQTVREYLMTLLNSNFEEWRLKNPQAPIDDFPFSTDKMSVSGSLFDIDKLRDVSKNTIAQLSAQQVYAQASLWAKTYDPELFSLMDADPDYAIEILNIGRGGDKPRKDISVWSELKDYMGFFYDQLFVPAQEYPENVSKEDTLEILKKYCDIYNEHDEQTEWFGKICALAGSLGFAEATKLYKKAPELYKGHVGDVSMVLRVAVTGRKNSPDMYQVMRILGRDKVIERLQQAIKTVEE